MAQMSIAAEAQLIDPRAAAMDSTTTSSAELVMLQNKYGDLSGSELLEKMIRYEFPGEVAVVSSFGAESAVLLHMVSEIDPTTPVIFLNTGKLFGETMRYRDRLQDKFGLTDLRSIAPHPDDLTLRDPNGVLWNDDEDACCFVRKVVPLERALKHFRASITGRKRFQTSARSDMNAIEEEIVKGTSLDGAKVDLGTRFKINPLLNMDLDNLKSYLKDHKLPVHPLVKDGYPSIGCMPCTSRVAEGGSYRDGRWASSGKDECGIHMSSTPDHVDGEGI